MDLTNFIKSFAEQFDDTDSSVFNENTKFKELDEWSSIMSLNIVAMVYEEYQVTLKGADIRNVKTIEELFNLVQSRS